VRVDEAKGVTEHFFDGDVKPEIAKVVELCGAGVQHKESLMLKVLERVNAARIDAEGAGEDDQRAEDVECRVVRQDHSDATYDDVAVEDDDPSDDATGDDAKGIVEQACPSDEIRQDALTEFHGTCHRGQHAWSATIRLDDAGSSCELWRRGRRKQFEVEALRVNGKCVEVRYGENRSLTVNFMSLATGKWLLDLL